jgi:hypothetical protein
MGSDGYFGSTSHIVVARNWITATHPTANTNLISVNIGRWNNYFSLVGNVLGTSAFSGSGLFQPEVSFSYSTPVIYKLGFPNMGNNGFSLTWGPATPPDYTLQSVNQAGGNSLQELDLNVKNTMIRHGNYDYKNNTVSWDAAISDYTIPASYFRTVKPAWFGNLAWPPFDPASPPGAFNNANLSKIPAGYRYVNGIDPPGSPATDKGALGLPPASGYDLTAGPLPFYPTLHVTYRVPGISPVEISVADLNGRFVKKLVSGKIGPGVYSAEWNAKGPKAFPSGVYCLVIRAPGFMKTIRAVLAK